MGDSANPFAYADPIAAGADTVLGFTEGFLDRGRQKDEGKRNRRMTRDQIIAEMMMQQQGLDYLDRREQADLRAGGADITKLKLQMLADRLQQMRSPLDRDFSMLATRARAGESGMGRAGTAGPPPGDEITQENANQLYEENFTQYLERRQAEATNFTAGLRETAAGITPESLFVSRGNIRDTMHENAPGLDDALFGGSRGQFDLTKIPSDFVNRKGDGWSQQDLNMLRAAKEDLDAGKISVNEYGMLAAKLFNDNERNSAKATGDPKGQGVNA